MKRLVLSILIIALFLPMALADNSNIEIKTKKWINNHPGELPIWLTPWEMKIWNNYSRDFYVTDPPPTPVRNVAEFEPMEAVIIRYPLGIPTSLVAEMAAGIKVITITASEYYMNQAIADFEGASVNMDNVEFLMAPTDSYWCRDYGPWFIFDGNNEAAVVNFPYNRPRPNDDDIPIEFAEEYDMELYGMDLFHTGGNWMSDGMGKGASTTLVETENPGLSESEIDQLVSDYLGIDTYYKIEDPLGDYIEHIDCWAKFLDVDKILIGQVPESDPRYDDFEAVADFFESTQSSYNTNYEVFRVYTPGNYDQTPYTNSLILNDRVFVPQSGSQWDDEAIAVYEEAMPGYEIVGIDYWDWMNTDALHCRTHEVADRNMLYIQHIPIQPEIELCEQVEISSLVYPYSGEELQMDSLKVFYSVNGSDYDSTNMEGTAEADMYNCFIPVAAGDSISYYIHAVDASGRSENHPYIGEADPHSFIVEGDGTAPEIDFEPIEGEFDIEDFPINISCQVTDNNQVTDVNLEWRFENEDTNVEEMINTNNDEWSLEFQPQNLAGGELIQYRIVATDSINNSYMPGIGWYEIIVNPVSTNENSGEKYVNRFISTYPNPFNVSDSNSLSINFSLDESQNVGFKIYNLKGRVVNEIKNTSYNKGKHFVTWDGNDYQNRKVSAGIYFIRMKTRQISTTKKILIIR